MSILRQKRTTKIVALDAVEVRDTTKRSVTIDISRFRSINIFLRDTHDKKVPITPRPFVDTTQKVWDGENFIEFFQVKAVDTTVHHVNTKLTWLNNFISDELRIVYQADESPDSGNITLIITGEVY